MAGEDIIMISQEELKRLHIIKKVIEGKMKQVEAVGILDLSYRQTRRIVKRVKEEGDSGIIEHEGRHRIGDYLKL
ncbi:MAG: helix-turn-helix domain-containing protein [Nitrospinae bacterium]|nr:helix-turn-helix domain-containing protein [Nitrospinota bacterium]MBI3815237.1 helix-turn-helix domain-containing protein [Nitrospinota bacterium]